MARDKMGLAIILGGMKRPEQMPDEDDERPGYEEGLDAAVDELFDALEKKDRRAAKEALKSFVTMCRDVDYDDEEETREE